MFRTIGGLFVPWTFRSMDFSYHAWTFRTVRTMDFSHHPRTFRTIGPGSNRAVLIFSGSWARRCGGAPTRDTKVVEGKGNMREGSPTSAFGLSVLVALLPAGCRGPAPRWLAPRTGWARLYFICPVP